MNPQRWGWAWPWAKLRRIGAAPGTGTGSLGKRSLSPLLPWVPDLRCGGEGESGSRDATLGARCCHVSPLSFPTMSVYPLGSQIND